MRLSKSAVMNPEKYYKWTITNNKVGRPPGVSCKVLQVFSRAQ